MLPKSFFMRDTCLVARDLLGKTLVRKYNGTTVRAIITETEAYKGFDDKASHASRGKTARNEIMFGEAGKIYVYLVYGMYYCLNIVTEQKKFPAAVLIRGAVLEDSGKAVDGPGRLTRALGVDKSLNAKTLGYSTGLWIEEGIEVPKSRIVAGPRVGVHYAGAWAKKPWRFSATL